MFHVKLFNTSDLYSELIIQYNETSIDTESL